MSHSERLALLVLAMCLAGCNSRLGEDVEIVPGELQADSFQEEQRTSLPSHVAEERFVFVASGLPQAQYETIRDFFKDVLTQSNTGDIVHVVACPSHEPIVSLEIPHGQVRVWLKDSTFAKAAKTIKEFLLRAPDLSVANCPPAQLDFPRIVRTVKQLSAGKERLTIFAFGDPVFCPDPEHAWRFTDFCVPSDAALHSEECPFGPVERVSLPKPGAEMFLIARGAEWGDSAEHRVAIERFYGLYLNEVGGVFQGVFGDAKTAFKKSLHSHDNPSLPVAGLRADPFVGMWCTRHTQLRASFDPRATEVHIAAIPAATRRAPDVQIAPPSPLAAVPPALESYLQSLPPDNIAISIRWVALRGNRGDSQSDLDIWIRDKTSREPELNYRHMQTTFGVLFRDVQHDLDSDDFTQWEYVEIAHDRLQDLDVWIDAYRTSCDLTCIVRAGWRGEVRETQIDFQGSSGDHAGDESRRAASPAWKHLSLQELFAE